MLPTRGVIRTPDQRIRVFVSSTLGELAVERTAVRAAIERIHLAPVMFELGARPHPPRELYRSYLEQSDVFVGLYWERYGWVAPGEQISGLEDEWQLSPGMPRLLYIKEPSPEREPRLAELIGGMEADNRASYTAFSTPEQLATLVENDLATLLAERFDLSRTEPAPVIEDGPATTAFPVPLTRLIGREADSARVVSLLTRPGVRLVTLTGPGGIGKSRLALDVAATAVFDGDDPAVFVDLSPITEPALVPNAIAQAIGVRDTGDEALVDKLVVALRHRRQLIVVDNFEQVLDAAPLLTTLLAAAPQLRFLVTSRALLRLNGEHAYDVGPLAVPSEGPGDTRRIADAASVALFVERARAVKPDFELTDDNAGVIGGISRALDGVPLAIELAAARLRILSPAAMLSRLDHRLTLLGAARGDRPARQQTLLSTIEWSTQLLGDDDRELLARLGVFAGSFTLDAVEAVAASGIDVLSGLEALVDSSLVREIDHGDRAWFSTLSTVREYAVEQLRSRGRLDDLRRAHAEYYLRLGNSLELALEDSRQRDEVAGLALDRDNLRATVRFFLNSHDWTSAAQISWTLYVYWWLGGHLGELRAWTTEILDSGDELDDFTHAVALYFSYAISLWQSRDDQIVTALTESARLFHRAGEKSGEGLAYVSLSLALLAAPTPDPDAAAAALERSLPLFRSNSDVWGESMALVTMGRLAILGGDLERAVVLIEQTLELTERTGDDFGSTIAIHHLGWARLMQQQTDAAASDFEQSLTNSARIGHVEGIAYGLEGLVAVAATGGQVRRAGVLLGASEALREHVGIANAPSFSFHARLLVPITSGPHAAELEAGRAEGRRMSAEEAVAFALMPRS